MACYASFKFKASQKILETIALVKLKVDKKLYPDSVTKAAFTRATFSCENRHFAFFLSQIALVTYTAQDSREILSARYRQTRPQKNQVVAVTHTGEILTRRSHTIATRRSHLQVETACQ